MMKVATASSLFQEKGLDKKGIFTLLVNAVDRENIDIACMTQTLVNCNNVLNSNSLDFNNCRIIAIDFLLEGVDNFSPDLEWAEQRISQFFADHAKLKNIRIQIDTIGFWEMIFSKRKEYGALIKEKHEIEDKRLTINELLNIAFYHYNQATGKNAVDFMSDLKVFLGIEKLRYS